ncbi:helix-turn-helix domain-containing protein [Adlercreutzia sp. ZJ304]|uniref:helix-turn-helix domain-containing protein n=1 Tax=Adlercreutzia sp. ZJ304 TaxID=2709791 RepID=UPI0013ED6C9F|nr:helix-turn-helix domain-containing protein [Adlercreutzia sp. ZJ304]
MAFEYTVKQCAQKLGISATRVHQLIKEGMLPAEMIAGRYFVDEDAVEARAESLPSPGRPPKRSKEDPRFFTLMNRNHEVFEFVYDNFSDEFTEVTQIIDPSRAPLGLMSPQGKKVSLSALTYWWKHRSIPLSRSGMEAKLATLGLSDPTRLPFKSLGLSLSDQYWIRPKEMNLDWHSINYFKNTFPEMLSGDWLEQVGLESPDNTSEGQLPKRWVRIDGVPALIKGGTSLNQEPYNEIAATCLYRRLLAPEDYVSYRLELLPDGETVSLCEVFISDEEEYIPAYYVMKAKHKAMNCSTYQHYLECCSRLKVENAEVALAKMIVTDDLLGNTDRHLRNFGLVRNVETMQYRPAPLFDTGSSLLNEKTSGALASGDLSFTTKPFHDDPNQQLRLVSDYSWFNANALEGFAEEVEQIFALNLALEQRIPYIKQLINKRIERILVISS